MPIPVLRIFTNGAGLSIYIFTQPFQTQSSQNAFENLIILGLKVQIRPIGRNCINDSSQSRQKIAKREILFETIIRN